MHCAENIGKVPDSKGFVGRQRNKEFCQLFLEILLFVMYSCYVTVTSYNKDEIAS